MDSTADGFDYDPRSVPKTNISWYYLRSGWKMSNDEFMVFKDQWKTLATAAGLTQMPSFSSKAGKARLNTFVTESLRSGQLPPKITTAPRPWCVLALASMTRVMKSTIAAQAKRLLSGSAKSLACAPKLPIPSRTAETKLDPLKSLLIQKSPSIPESPGEQHKSAISMLVEHDKSDISGSAIDSEVEAPTLNHDELHLLTDGFDAHVCSNRMSPITLSSNPELAEVPSPIAVVPNKTNSTNTGETRLESRPPLKVLLRVINSSNWKDSICSTRDLPSDLDAEASLFGNKDWIEWCRIIHEDCDWTKSEQPELDIMYSSSIIHNSRKWRATIEDRMSKASPEERSANMLTMDFTLENSSKWPLLKYEKKQQSTFSKLHYNSQFKLIVGIAMQSWQSECSKISKKGHLKILNPSIPPQKD
jgi:hypothetical protein